MEFFQAITVLGIFITIFFLTVFQIESVKKHIDKSSKKIEEKIESFNRDSNENLYKISNRIMRLENRISDIESEVESLFERLERIEDYVSPKKKLPK